jgi:ATP-binding cassette subfamily C protein CydD
MELYRICNGFLASAMMKKPPSTDEKRCLGWLFDQSRTALLTVGLSIGAGVANGLLVVAQASLLARIVHNAFIEGRPVGDLSGSFALLALVFLARAIAGWGREVTSFAAGARVRGRIRDALICHMIALGPAFADREEAGALSSVVLNQVEALHDFVAFYLPQLALSAIVPAVIAAAIFPVNWAAGILLIAAVPLIPLFMILVGMGAESIAQRNFQALARLSAHFLDVLQGLTTLKLFDRSKAETLQIRRISDDYRRQTMKVLRVAFLSSAVLEFITSMAIAIVAVYLGMRYLGYLDFGGYGRPLDLADGFFILLLAPEFFLPLRELGARYHAKAEAVGAANGIIEILSTPLPPPPTTTHPSHQRAPIHIEFKDVGFSYGGNPRQVLSGATASVAPGEFVALVGPSGAGKTTLFNLIMGFASPDSGTIEANGMANTGVMDRSKPGAVPRHHSGKHSTGGPFGGASGYRSGRPESKGCRIQYSPAGRS